MKEEIIEILSNQDKPAQTAIEINDALGFKSIEEYKNLEETLEKMVRKGTLYYSEKKKRYLLLTNSHLIKGKLLMNPKGYGFVEIGDGKKDVYIGKDNINGARNNDTVLIEIINNKNEGRIAKVINRDENTIVGTVYFKDGRCYAKPDKKSNIDIEILPESQKGLVEGHKVLIKPDGSNKYQGNVLHVIGHKNDVGVDILSKVYEYGFNIEENEKIEEELANIPDTIENEDISDRLDLRDEVIFTIDGDDTKDIDDAISIKKFPDGTYELGVHIADVSHYVKEGSEIDKDAYSRATSVYLVDRVVPMLPHQLSNGICSLNPNVDRLAFSCIMKIDSKGKVIDYNIKESVIRSRIQMTYNKVNDILEKGIIPEGYEEYVDNLKAMNELSDILRKKMVNRGYIEFKSAEPKILVDENCHPTDIKLRYEGTGENMIENFMVAANETVASYIFYQELAGIYRIHAEPDEKRLQTFFDFLSARGYSVNGKRDNITSKDLQDILTQLSDKPDAKILNDMAIRSQAKAVYSNENIGHFGLGSDCYSHFTSPIRRYPDLTLHRILKDYIKNYSNKNIEKWENKLPEISKYCSSREQDAQQCERDVNDLKMAEYMEEHIGEEFEGVISGVQEFGVYIELPNTIEGLAKIENMPLSGGYHYVQNQLSLVNKNRKHTYMFGDSVKVKCIRADKETGQIDFQLLGKLKKDDYNYNEKKTEFKKEVKKYAKTKTKKKKRG